MKYAAALAFPFLFSAFVFPGSPTLAADIGMSSDPECRVDINGHIEFGDFEKLAALKEHLVIDDGESTSGSVVW